MSLALQEDPFAIGEDENGDISWQAASDQEELLRGLEEFGAQDTSFGLDIIKEEEEELEDRSLSSDDHMEEVSHWNHHDTTGTSHSLPSHHPHPLGPEQYKQASSTERHVIEETFLPEDDEEGSSFTSPTRRTYSGSWQEEDYEEEKDQRTNETRSYSSSEKSSLVILDDDDDDTESSYYSVDVDALVESILFQEQGPWGSSEPVEDTSFSEDPEDSQLEDLHDSVPLPVNASLSTYQAQHEDCSPATSHELFQRQEPQRSVRGGWDHDDENEAHSSASSLSTLAVSYDSISLPGQSSFTSSKQRRRGFYILFLTILFFTTVVGVHWELSRRQAAKQRDADLRRRRSEPQRPLWLLLEEL